MSAEPGIRSEVHSGAVFFYHEGKAGSMRWLVARGGLVLDFVQFPEAAV